MKSRGSITIQHHRPRAVHLATFFLLTALIQVSLCQQNALTSDWQQERPANLPQIQNLEVMCAKDHMEVQLSFDKPFTGLVFSKGQYGSDNCVYVQPKSGRNNFRFSIIYNGCGTKPDAKGKFYENTVVVQYDEELIEVWDEAKRLRCEWYNDYEKTATKPPMVIADLEVVELNFRGDNVDCWMEIQNGKGPWASPINGIVPLGSTLTMVVAINDLAGEFDMRVKSCEASDGVNRPIQLSDEHGCVLRPKMVSKFLKLRSNDGRSTVMSYAFFHAFKFPDSLQVYVRCKVEICRHGCPEHCDKTVSRHQPQPAASAAAAPLADLQPYGSENKAVAYTQPELSAVHPIPAPPPPQRSRTPDEQQAAPVAAAVPVQQSSQQPQSSNKRPFFGLNLGRKPSDSTGRPGLFSKKKDAYLPLPVASAHFAPPPPPASNTQVQAQVVDVPIPIPGSQIQDPISVSVPSSPIVQSNDPATDAAAPAEASGAAQERHADDEEQVEDLAVDGSAPKQAKLSASRSGFPYGPRGLDLEDDSVHIQDISAYETAQSASPEGNKKQRVKRSYDLSQHHGRQVRSADVGVKVGYEVVSAVDLAFSLNGLNASDGDSTPGVTIFQGKMREEVVYGICLPAPGFSALFVLLAMCVVISVLVASFLCYHRQLQKADREGCPSSHHPSFGMGVMGITPAVPFRDWSTVHFIRNPSKSIESQSSS